MEKTQPTRGIHATMEEKLAWTEPINKADLKKPVRRELDENPIESKRFNFQGENISLLSFFHHH